MIRTRMNSKLDSTSSSQKAEGFPVSMFIAGWATIDHFAAMRRLGVAKPFIDRLCGEGIGGVEAQSWSHPYCSHAFKIGILKELIR